MMEQKLGIEINWKQQYEVFESLHGGDPVVLVNEDTGLMYRLLFRDGWTHDVFTYVGPGYPPPEDPVQLAALKLQYWNKRKDEKRDLLREITGVLRNADEWYQAYGTELSLVRQVQTVSGDGTCKPETMNLTRDDLRGIKDRFEQDVEECNEEISRLNNELLFRDRPRTLSDLANQ